MKRKLYEGHGSADMVTLNITQLCLTPGLKHLDTNIIRDELENEGATVEGFSGNCDGANCDVYMTISDMNVDDALLFFEDAVLSQTGVVINARDFVTGDAMDYRDDDVDVEDYPDYDDVEIEESTEKTLGRNWRHITEKKSSCCPPRKKHTSHYRSLAESLKAFDEKKQKALGDSEEKVIRTIDDIVNAAKGKYITSSTAKDALDKLKKENKVLSRIKKNAKGDVFSVKDVKGATKALNTLRKNVSDNKTEKAIADFQAALKESVMIALKKNRRSLHESVKVNGKKLGEYSLKEIESLINEAKDTRKKMIEMLKEGTLNESTTTDWRAKIKKKNMLLDILDEELTYRVTRAKCIASLCEGDGDGEFTDADLANMFGAPQGEDMPAAESSDAESSDAEADADTDEEVELARVVITVKNMEAAEDLKKACADAGIPEDAMDIDDGEEDEEESSDAEAEEESSDAEEAEAESNESVRYDNIARLFEDDEEGVDNGGSDAPADDAADDKPVKFVLTDTDYINTLSDVLDDVYGISKEELEDMIGGEIVNEEPDAESSDDAEAAADADEDVPEDDFNPEDIFKGL